MAEFRNRLSLPQHQARSASLDQEAQLALQRILSEHAKLPVIRMDIRSGIDFLHDSVGGINQYLDDHSKAAESRKLQQERKDGNINHNLAPSEAGNAVTVLNELTTKVNSMTQRMDNAVKRSIDGYAGLQSIDETVIELCRNHSEIGREDRHNKTSVTQPDPCGESIRALESHRGDTVNNVTQLSYENASPSEITQYTPKFPNLTRAYMDTLKRKHDQYAALSSFDRYSEHPDYHTFKNIIDVACDREGTRGQSNDRNRYASEGNITSNSATGTTNNCAEIDPLNRSVKDNSDDSEIAISAIRISTRCPLTLLQFHDPIKSKVCSHAFEKDAIIDLINRQRPPTRNRQPSTQSSWVPSVACPVHGCDRVVRIDDLQHDPVLARRIKRMQDTEKSIVGAATEDDYDVQEDDIDNVAYDSPAVSIRSG